MYGGYITVEKTMMYNFRYRFIDYKGNFFDTDDFDEFQTAFKVRLWRVFGDI